MLLLTSVTFLKSHIRYFWQFCRDTGMLNLFIFIKNYHLFILMHNERHLSISFIIYKLLLGKHNLKSIKCLTLYIFVTLLLGTRIWKLYLHVNSLSILRHKLSFIYSCSSFLFAWMNKKE